MFADPLTEQDLYWLGYLQADGCMVSKIGEEYRPGLFRKTGGYLTFAQIYKEPVVALHEYVKAEGKVRLKIRDTNFIKNHEMYLFSSSKPYYTLKDLGLKKQLRQDIYASPHFWRGMLDGDGSLGMYRTTKYNWIYPSLTWCGNEYDMNKCADFVESCGFKRPKIGKARSIFRVGRNGNPALELVKALYDGNYNALSVKKERANLIMKWRT